MDNLLIADRPDRPFAMVEWADPHSPSSADVINDENIHLYHRGVTILTTGWVLRDDPIGISIANEYAGDGDYRGTTVVLRSLIRAVTPLPDPFAKRRGRRGQRAANSANPNPTPNQDNSHAEPPS